MKLQNLVLTAFLLSGSAFGQALLLLGTGGSVATGGGTCTPASGFLGCAVITIPYGLIGTSDLNNYVQWTPLALGVGVIQSASCDDVIFTTDSAGATKTPWRIVSCNQSTGDVKAQVKIPFVSHTSPGTTFYASFNQTGISGPQNTGLYAPANVWESAYKQVLALDEASGLSGYADSTANANNGIHGTHDPTATTGELAGAQLFNGTNNTLNSGPVTLGNTFTVSLWANWTDVTYYQYFLSNFDYSKGMTGFSMALYNDSHVRAAISVSSGYANCSQTPGSTTVTPGTWYHLALVWNGTNQTCKLYVNGKVDVNIASGAATFADSTAPVSIGGVNGLFMKGTLDDVRWYAGDRESQVIADFNSQKPNSQPGGSASFLTVTIH